MTQYTASPISVALSTRPRGTDSRYAATDAAARKILDAKETEREAKTARLRALRLARESESQHAA